MKGRTKRISSSTQIYENDITKINKKDDIVSMNIENVSSDDTKRLHKTITTLRNKLSKTMRLRNDCDNTSMKLCDRNNNISIQLKNISIQLKNISDNKKEEQVKTQDLEKETKSVNFKKMFINFETFEEGYIICELKDKNDNNIYTTNKIIGNHLAYDTLFDISEISKSDYIQFTLYKSKLYSYKLI